MHLPSQRGSSIVIIWGKWGKTLNLYMSNIDSFCRVKSIFSIAMVRLSCTLLQWDATLSGSSFLSMGFKSLHSPGKASPRNRLSPGPERAVDLGAADELRPVKSSKTRGVFLSARHESNRCDTIWYWRELKYGNAHEKEQTRWIFKFNQNEAFNIPTISTVRWSFLQMLHTAF